MFSIRVIRNAFWFQQLWLLHTNVKEIHEDQHDCRLSSCRSALLEANYLNQVYLVNLDVESAERWMRRELETKQDYDSGGPGLSSPELMHQENDRDMDLVV